MFIQMYKSKDIQLTHTHTDLQVCVKYLYHSEYSVASSQTASKLVTSVQKQI